MKAPESITGTDRAMILTYLEPPRPDGGPRQARADLVEYVVEIGEDGARDIGRRIVRSGLVLLGPELRDDRTTR